MGAGPDYITCLCSPFEKSLLFDITVHLATSLILPDYLPPCKQPIPVGIFPLLLNLFPSTAVPPPICPAMQCNLVPTLTRIYFVYQQIISAPQPCLPN